MDHTDRPDVWVGHVRLVVHDPVAAHDWYASLGMRSVERGDDFSITELRGGTHLLLERGEPEPGDAPFDLMSEDLQETHGRFSDAGLDVSAVIPGDVHSVFVLTDPDGYRIVVFDDHCVGPV